MTALPQAVRTTWPREGAGPVDASPLPPVPPCPAPPTAPADRMALVLIEHGFCIEPDSEHQVVEAIPVLRHAGFDCSAIAEYGLTAAKAARLFALVHLRGAR